MADVEQNSISIVTETAADERIRVFRRIVSLPGKFASLQVDAYAVLSRHYIVLCDTLLCPEDADFILQSLAVERTGRQVLVVNSHADWDHVWGNSYFGGEQSAPIIAHAQCATRLRSPEAHRLWQEYQQHYPIFRNVALLPPTITFTTELEISGGDLTLQLFAAPGHTHDHIAIWISELRLLLAFDAVEQPWLTLYDAQSVPLLYATLRKFLSLQPQRVLCSHGESTGGPALVQENLDYLQVVERHCRTFLYTRRVTNDELERPAHLVGYPFEAALADHPGSYDMDFYRQVHEENVRSMLYWLMSV